MFSSDFKEISAGEFISITGGLVAGMLLAKIRGELILIPGLFILIVGFLEMKGNINSSLASRLSSALHVGYIKPRLKASSFLKENVLAAALLSIVVSCVLGIVSFLATYIYFHVFYIKIFYIALAAAIVSNLIIIPLNIIACFWLFRHSHDPDNIMGPYITTIGDIVSISSLFVAIMVIA